MTPASIQKIPLHLIDRNEDQPRQSFPADHIEGLAKSIEENGLLQPITVRKKRDGRFEIIAGECRFRAHQLLEERGGRALKISAVVRKTTIANRDIMAIIENLQRRDVNLMEEARAYKRMLDHGWSESDLASKLGLKNVGRIRQRVALLNLREQYQDLVEKGSLTPYQAQFMMRLSTDRQDRLFRAIKDGKCEGWEKLKMYGDTLHEEQQQGSMFSDEETGKISEDDERALTTMERRIEAVARMVTSGFSDDNAVTISRKVRPDRANEMADRLDLIGRHVQDLARHLRKGAAQLDLCA
ncbi:MAG: ParB/RepB/Spo0J family partition protein [Geminicoccaceae bacterium]